MGFQGSETVRNRFFVIKPIFPEKMNIFEEKSWLKKFEKSWYFILVQLVVYCRVTKEGGCSKHDNKVLLYCRVMNTPPWLQDNNVILSILKPKGGTIDYTTIKNQKLNKSCLYDNLTYFSQQKNITVISCNQFTYNDLKRLSV